jgi:hypothetical protein
MPAPVVAAIIAGAASTAGTVYAVNRQRSAGREAMENNTRAIEETRRIEEENEKRRREEFDAQLALQKQAHDATQAELSRQADLEQSRFDLRERQMQPYREEGVLALRDLGARRLEPSAPAPAPMRSDPYDVMAGRVRTMGELARPASVVNVADLDPRWRRA